MWYFKGINRTILSEHIIRRIEAEKETWNKLVTVATNNNFDHVGTLKYINLLLHIDIHFQRVKYIINEQSTNINVFLLFLSFVFLQIERERERGGVYKIGYKEKWSQSLLIFFTLMEFLWRIFPLLRANRLYAIFNTCRWREGVPTSVLGSQRIVWLLPSSIPCQAIRYGYETSPKSGYWIQIAFPNLLSCLNGHSLMILMLIQTGG